MCQARPSGAQLVGRSDSRRLQRDPNRYRSCSVGTPGSRGGGLGLDAPGVVSVASRVSPNLKHSCYSLASSESCWRREPDSVPTRSSRP
jgi:hypothetical protein